MTDRLQRIMESVYSASIGIKGLKYLHTLPATTRELEDLEVSLDMVATSLATILSKVEEPSESPVRRVLKKLGVFS